MSQQEFEPRQQRPDDELYQMQYPYSWSEQAPDEGMPRDEPYSSDTGSQNQNQNNAAQSRQVPWWARPQPQRQNGSLTLAALIVLLVLVGLLLGGFGIVGLVLGSLAHLLAVIIGAGLMLILFVGLFILILLRIIGRALGGATGMNGSRYDRWAWRNSRRMIRRAGRRGRRGW